MYTYTKAVSPQFGHGTCRTRRGARASWDIVSNHWSWLAVMNAFVFSERRAMSRDRAPLPAIPDIRANGFAELIEAEVVARPKREELALVSVFDPTEAARHI